jgi:putative oxidoreductase
MALVLRIVQSVLALAFIAAGFVHATQRDRPRPGMAWMQAVPAPLLTTIGLLEIAGGIGLIAPMATGIVPALTPLAAIALVVLMVFAAIFHLRRPGEMPNIAFNAVLGLIALFVAYGRLVLAPVAS